MSEINGIPLVEENVVDIAPSINLSIKSISAMMGIPRVLSLGSNAPPASPGEMDLHVVGTSPAGAWAGQADRLARYLSGLWEFYDVGAVVNLGDGTLYIRLATWTAVGP